MTMRYSRLALSSVTALLVISGLSVSAANAVSDPMVFTTNAPQTRKRAAL